MDNVKGFHVGDFQVCAIHVPLYWRKSDICAVDISPQKIEINALQQF